MVGLFHLLVSPVTFPSVFSTFAFVGRVGVSGGEGGQGMAWKEPLSAKP